MIIPKKLITEQYTVPDDSSMYQALMSHYIHYDKQFWSRTQILLAIQGAAFIGGYKLRFYNFGFLIMFAAAVLVLIIWALIYRDICNSRINEGKMDKLSNMIFKNKGEKPVVLLRDDPPKIFNIEITGRRLIHFTIFILVCINIVLGYYYRNYRDELPPNTNRNIMVFENQIKKMSSKLSSDMGEFKDQLKDFNNKLNTVKKDMSNVDSLKNQITELSSSLSTNIGKLDYQLKGFDHKLKSLENKLSDK